jgi:hypothetical protein
VSGRRFSPLDRQLRLRADHWSDGGARVAARQGLQAKSFDKAAEAYSEAVGGAMSADSVQRITQSWGAQLEAQRQVAAEGVNALAARGDSPLTQRLTTHDPIVEQANISTDGAMMLVRNEGWKEVKLTAISAVTVKPAGERATPTERPSRRAPDPLVELSRHSYQAGLWDADTMAQHQYKEGLRRGLEDCARLSSVNDGAGWIERITQTNFPQAPQIVDWSHASQRLWAVGNLVLGEGSATAKVWVTAQLDALWNGRVSDVVNNLDELAAERPLLDVQQAAGYFRNNAARMRYAEYRARGYPIGSGTVESAANTVIHDRLKRPGRGWKRENGQAMLAALSELHSDRFDHAWQSTVAATA